ncbi:MAG: TSUP family transporter [Bacteroidota bacterium]
MDYLVISIVALAASALTLFSGFGLGTILLPAFLLFFPADLAVAMTAIVHFSNNLFKLVLLGRHAHRGIVLRFGIPAIVASFIGAWVLLLASDVQPLLTYQIGQRLFAVTFVKVVMGLLIAAFAVLEMLPAFTKIEFDRKHVITGGLLSGFFGGLSGHQGALRSAFLVRAGLSKEAFIATGVVIACLVDITRLSVYVGHFSVSGIGKNIPLVLVATGAAFVGVFLGNKLLNKLTMTRVQQVVSVLLLMIALGLITGLI